MPLMATIVIVAMLVSSTDVRLCISSVVVPSDLRGCISSPDLRGCITTTDLRLGILSMVVVAIIISTMVVGLVIPVALVITFMAISCVLVVGIIGVVVLILCWQTGTRTVRRLARGLGDRGLVTKVSQEDSVGFVAARVVLVFITTDLGLEVTRRLLYLFPNFQFVFSCVPFVISGFEQERGWAWT